MPFLAFDCEGPITLNDNAFEFASAIIPQGGRFFKQISRFDDYLADIKKRENYKAGDTLRLILPFLKLFGATNKALEEFSERTLILLPKMDEILKSLLKNTPVYIISTSYRPYLVALGKRIGFPMENVFCTEVDLDRVKISQAEAKILTEIYERILSFPDIELPPSAKAPHDLPQNLRDILDEMEYLFFEKVWNLDSGVFLREVNPIGGREKAKACEEISKGLSISLSEGFYCGDSITDTEALSLLRKAKGVSLSFNGNRYALRSAEFYALGYDGEVIGEVALSFLNEGKDALYKLKVKEDKKEFGLIPNEEKPLSELISRSEETRKKVRGILIGELG